MSDYLQILTDLKRKIYKPVYFLCGEEAYFIDKLSDYIENNVLDESEREFNQTVIYGREVDMGTIISSARRYPMMSEYQVLIVKEAQTMKEFGSRGGGEDAAPSKDKGGANTKDLLLQYVGNPQPTTILVFCHKYKTLDKRTALAKAVTKHAVFFESKKLYENKIPDWTSAYLKEKNFKINPRASALLTDYLGNDLSKIANELDKLIINVPEGAEISMEHIQENIGISKDYNVFELQSALAKKDVLRSNRIVNYFAENPNDNPLVLTLASLNSYFMKVLSWHFVPDKSKFNVAKVLAINPYFVEDYERAGKNYTTAKLKSIFSLLRETDIRSKGIENVSVTHGELLKELVFRILH